jgi:hypothetical protein
MFLSCARLCEGRAACRGQLLAVRLENEGNGQVQEEFCCFHLMYPPNYQVEGQGCPLYLHIGLSPQHLLCSARVSGPQHGGGGPKIIIIFRKKKSKLVNSKKKILCYSGVRTTPYFRVLQEKPVVTSHRQLKSAKARWPAAAQLSYQVQSESPKGQRKHVTRHTCISVQNIRPYDTNLGSNQTPAILRFLVDFLSSSRQMTKKKCPKFGHDSFLPYPFLLSIH